MIDDKIIQIKKQLEEIHTRKIQTATRLKSLEMEKEELLRECHLLNVDPHKIDETIKQHEELINRELKLIEQELKKFYVS